MRAVSKNLRSRKEEDLSMKWLSILLSLALLAAIGFSQNRSRGFPTGPIVDLSYAFDSETVYWPTAEPFRLEKDFEGVTDQGFYYSAYRYSGRRTRWHASRRAGPFRQGPP